MKVMTIKEREDRFIEDLRDNQPAVPMTWETELMLRFGFSRGAEEMAVAAFELGVQHQTDSTLMVLGAAPLKRGVSQ